MKNLILVILIMITIPLSACVGASPETVSMNAAPNDAQNNGTTASNQAAGSSTANALNTTYENAVSVDMQLLVGMFKLEGSDLAISKDQATAILPLLANIQTSRVRPNSNPAGSNPSQNGNSAQQATPSVGARVNSDGLFPQIQALLSEQQITAIADMKLTQDGVNTILQAQGITMGGGPQMRGNDQALQGTPQAGANNGNNAAPSATGNPPVPNGQNTNTPMRNSRTGNGFVPPQLIEKLIQILDGKAGIVYNTPTPSA